MSNHDYNFRREGPHDYFISRLKLGRLRLARRHNIYGCYAEGDPRAERISNKCWNIHISQQKKLDKEGQHFCVLTINYQLARIFNFLIQKTFKRAGLFKGIIENTLTLFYILMKYLRSQNQANNIFAKFYSAHRLTESALTKPVPSLPQHSELVWFILT